MGNTELFNKMASKYDSAERLEVNSLITKEIKQELTADFSDKILLDYGCGTGEVGLNFVNEFERVVFADTSTNMLEIVSDKIADKRITNACTVEITEGQDLQIKADVIVVSQVLLHVADTVELLASLARTLNQSGILLLVDFEKNELVQSDLVHNGFDLNSLSELVLNAGLSKVKTTAFLTRENLFMGKEATLFCLKAEKKDSNPE